MEAFLRNIDVVGGVMALVVGAWMVLTLATGLMRGRTNFLIIAIQLFGFLFLIRDLGLPVAERHMGLPVPPGMRDAVTALLIISAGFVVDRLWRHFVWDGFMVADGGAPPPRLLRGAFTALIVLISCGIVISWVYGQSVTGLVAASGVVAIVIGYAAQSTLSDLLSGIAIALSPAFKIGDVLDMDGDWVEVQDQNWRVTKTKHVDGRTIYYPNSVLANRQVVNTTGARRTIRQVFDFSAEPSSPPQVIRDAVMEAIGQCRLVDHAADNAVWITGHGEFGFRVQAMFFTTFEDYVEAQTEIANLIWYTFRKYGVEIGYNRNHLYDTDWTAAVRTNPRSLVEQSHAEDAFAVACRASVELAGLTDAQIGALKKISKPMIFGGYERMIRAGDESDNLYLLTAGAMDVYIPIEGGETKVATMQAPTLVGFMALAMKQPRSASLYATSASSVYEIDGRDFADFVGRHEALMTSLIESSAKMQLSNEAARRDAALSQQEEAARLSSLKLMFRERLSDLMTTT
ncbi:MAG: mechanosensitive ion channel family protein [Pseudomonadota bacterium]